MTSVTPLDLSSAPTPSKRLKSDLSMSISTNSNSNGSTLPKSSPISGATTTAAYVTQIVAANIPCSAQSEEINLWSINDVFNFVDSIDLCKEYAEVSTNFKYKYFI